MFFAAVKTLILLSKLLPINTNNYVNHIRQRFGPLLAGHVFSYAKLQIKQAKIKQDLLFLKVCKHEQLTPTFVRVKIPVTHQHYKRAIHLFRIQLLQDEIKIKKRKLTQNYKLSNNLMSLLKNEITGLTLMKLKTIFKQLVQNKLVEWTATHDKKLNSLREDKMTVQTKTTTSKPLNVIRNLSSRQLTDDETSTLEHGLDFVYPAEKFDDRTFIANIETYFVNILGHATEKRDYEEKDEEEPTIYNMTPIQLECANKLRSTCNTFRRIAMNGLKKHKQNTKQTTHILKALAKDDTIIITRPDKGRGIVILNKHDYIKKMNDLLSDTNTFKELNEDPTIKQENKLNSKLLELKNNNFITNNEYNYARSRGSQPGRIYGLPKVHKTIDDDGIIPLRPIVSSSNTYNYRLAKLLANKLNHFRKSSTIIKDTFSFIDWLHKLKIDPNNYKMLSFDITSLFTKVPLDQTIDLILDKLYGIKHTCIFSKEPKLTWCEKCRHRYDMKFLLEISTKETHFLFNNKIYCQHNGIAMGSPLGPLFADIYVNYLEDKFMKRIMTNGVEYYKRFVDDTFILARKDTDKDKIVDILNSYDNEIQFTCVEEKEAVISFLDVNVQRTTTLSSPFITSVYRKPSFTGLILKWSSFVPKTYKISAISSLIYRAIKICSSFNLILTEFDFIRDMAIKNGYPINFIESQIRKTFNRYYKQNDECNPKVSTTASSLEKKKEHVYIDIPYFDNETEKLGKKLIKIAAYAHPHLHVQPIPRPPPAISAFFSSKDKIPISLQSGVVYEIPCLDCPACYVGKTLRQVQRRLHEHGQPSPLNEKPVATPQPTTNNQLDTRRSTRTRKPIDRYGISQTDVIDEEFIETMTTHPIINQSALWKHTNEHKHIINWDKTKILDKDSKPYRLLIRESLAIKQRQPTLNRTVNSVPLLVFPEGLIVKKPTVKIKYNTVTLRTTHEGGR